MPAVSDLNAKIANLSTTDERPRRTSGAARGRGRGGHRGGGSFAPSNAKVDVPAADFDFESANKKFNKEDFGLSKDIGNIFFSFMKLLIF